jgi:hypothetical protein
VSGGEQFPPAARKRIAVGSRYCFVIQTSSFEFTCTPMRQITITTLILLFCTPALAVRTSYWTHQSEADFRRGTFDKVVATNLGDLKLSRAVTTLLEQDPRVSAVNALAEMPDGTIYAGTGPQGVLLRVKDGSIDTALKLSDGVSIFSLLADSEERLLIGTGGQKGQVLRYQPGNDEPQVLFDSSAVQYIWALQQTPDGAIYAATGPHGQLFELREGAEPKVLLESSENNLLCLISDGNDLLYAGTDPNGRVYRVNRRTGEAFVMYDAPESEISALALDRRGNLYAATGQPSRTPEAAAGPATPHDIGRPEGGTTGFPIPAEPPADPTPPPMPDPNPGEPEPIPHGTTDALPTPIAIVRNQPLDLDDAPEPREDPGAPEAPEAGDGDGDGEDEVPTPPARVPREDAEGDLHPGVSPGRQPTVDAAATGQTRPGGNAIYRIDRDGFVTEVFREQALVLSMLEHNGSLLVGTGSEGHIF